MNRPARPPWGQWPFFPPKYWSHIKIQTHRDPLSCQVSCSKFKRPTTPHLLAPQLQPSASRGRWSGEQARLLLTRPALLSRRAVAESEGEGGAGRRGESCHQPSWRIKRPHLSGVWLATSGSDRPYAETRFPKNLQCYITNRNL